MHPLTRRRRDDFRNRHAGETVKGHEAVACSIWPAAAAGLSEELSAALLQAPPQIGFDGNLRVANSSRRELDTTALGDFVVDYPYSINSVFVIAV
ncbi:MAG: hypothetical protein QOH33_493 [Paraburkholderia sp.]|nr:hypothetical protein [Paraburkholderia sp.]